MLKRVAMYDNQIANIRKERNYIINRLAYIMNGFGYTPRPNSLYHVQLAMTQLAEIKDDYGIVRHAFYKHGINSVYRAIKVLKSGLHACYNNNEAYQLNDIKALYNDKFDFWYVQVKDPNTFLVFNSVDYHDFNGIKMEILTDYLTMYHNKIKELEGKKHKISSKYFNHFAKKHSDRKAPKKIVCPF